MKKRKSTLLLLVFFAFCFMESAAFELSNHSEISILTCSPGNKPYSVYGHSAIRVRDSIFRYDVVFNYGIFDFNSSNFVMRFAKGQTNYLLGTTRFETFFKGYVIERRGVLEQRLNLTLIEKQKIFDFLLWNADPENRVYRYNFFFDNCATRVRDVIEQNIDGGLEYTGVASGKTFRDLIKDCQKRLPWLNYGVDFLVGADADKEASLREEMFIPDYMMKHFSLAMRSNSGQPIVAASHMLNPAPKHNLKGSVMTSPFAVFSLLFFLILVLSLREFLLKNMTLLLDFVVYSISGLAGIFIGWFVLYSEHPAMSPNYNLLWLFPLNAIFALLLLKKKWRPVLKYYHLFASFWWILFMITGAFLPQKFNPLFLLITGIFLIRPLLHSVTILKRT